MKLKYEGLYVRIKFSWIKTLETQYTFVKIGLRETYCTYESCIFMGKDRAKLDRGAILWTIFI